MLLIVTLTGITIYKNGSFLMNKYTTKLFLAAVLITTPLLGMKKKNKIVPVLPGSDRPYIIVAYERKGPKKDTWTMYKNLSEQEIYDQLEEIPEKTFRVIIKSTDKNKQLILKNKHLKHLPASLEELRLERCILKVLKLRLGKFKKMVKVDLHNCDIYFWKSTRGKIAKCLLECFIDTKTEPTVKAPKKCSLYLDGKAVNKTPGNGKLLLYSCFTVPERNATF